MPVNEGMKRFTPTLAPAPRLTLWVPALASIVLGLIWLGFAALFYR